MCYFEECHRVGVFPFLEVVFSKDCGDRTVRWNIPDDLQKICRCNLLASQLPLDNAEFSACNSVLRIDCQGLLQSSNRVFGFAGHSQGNPFTRIALRRVWPTLLELPEHVQCRFITPLAQHLHCITIKLCLLLRTLFVGLHRSNRPSSRTARERHRDSDKHENPAHTHQRKCAPGAPISFCSAAAFGNQIGITPRELLPFGPSPLESQRNQGNGAEPLYYRLLEGEFPCKLYLSRVAIDAVNLHKRGLDRVGSADTASSGVGEVSVVKCVEELGAELDTLRLREPEVLHRRKVRVCIRRTSVPIAHCLAECILRRRDEATDVIPLVDGLFESGRHKLTTRH